MSSFQFLIQKRSTFDDCRMVVPVLFPFLYKTLQILLRRAPPPSLIDHIRRHQHHLKETKTPQDEPNSGHMIHHHLPNMIRQPFMRHTNTPHLLMQLPELLLVIHLRELLLDNLHVALQLAQLADDVGGLLRVRTGLLDGALRGDAREDLVVAALFGGGVLGDLGEEVGDRFGDEVEAGVEVFEFGFGDVGVVWVAGFGWGVGHLLDVGDGVLLVGVGIGVCGGWGVRVAFLSRRAVGWGFAGFEDEFEDFE